MGYRKDKFIVGDRVVWHPDIVSSWNKENAGEGPFVITEVFDRQQSRYDHDDYDYGQSTWDSMGHTQHVKIDKDVRPESMYSGAYFIKIPNRWGE